MSRWEKMIAFLIYLFVFLLPFSTVWLIKEQFMAGFKWPEGTYLLYGTEILLWLIVLGQLLYFFKKNKISHFYSLISQAGRLKILIASFLLALFLYAGLSIFWSTDKTLSFYWWLKLIEALVLMFIIISARFNIKPLLWSLALSAAVQALIAFWQFLNQAVAANKWLGMASHLPAEITSSVISTGDYRWLRAYGTLPHPNILGGFLVIGLLAVLYLYFKESNNWRRLLLVANLIFITVGLFFSFSRSAWLAALFLYFVWTALFFYRQKFTIWLKISFYLLLVLAPLIIIYQPLVMTRLSAQERLEERSIKQRLNSLVEAKEIFSKNPVFGVGLGNYTYYLSVSKPGFLGWSYQSAHNLYLLILAELGLVGLGLFLAIIILSVYQAGSLWAISAVGALLITGLFDHYLWTTYFGLVLFWLIIGLLWRQVSDKWPD